MDKNITGASLVSAPLSYQLPGAVAGFEAVAAPASPNFKPSHCVDAELLLSTPLTVVVRARIEHVDVDGHGTEREVALVIPRSRCEGDHPYWPALLSAAQEHWHRCPGQPRRLSARVRGDWQTLLAGDLRH